MPSRLKELLSRPSRRSSHQEVYHPSPSATNEPSTPLPSDSPSSRPTPSSSGNDDDFVALWRDALDDFWCLTGEDICDENSTLNRCLKGCSDYAGVVKILEDHALAFKAYRQGSPNALKMRAALRPVVRAVLTVIDVGAETAASKAVPGGKAIFVALAVLLRTVQGMSARFDALVVLLEKFGSFLGRLDIRVNAPLEPVSRTLIVKTLVEMLHTLAYATRMMRQNRAKHFFTVLIGQGGGLTELTSRTENLMIEETRLSLAEVHSRMHDLSDAFMTTLKQIEDDIVQLSKRMDALSMDVDGVSEQLRVSGVYNMPQQFHAFVERYEENRVDNGSDRILELSMTSLRNDISVQTALITAHVSESEMRLRHNLRQDLLAEPCRPRTSFIPHSNWASQVFLPCVDMTSFAHMTAEVISCFQGLSPGEQAILKEGIVTLFSAAATSVSMGSSDRTVILAGVLYPGAVLSGFLPMAVVFLAIFALWRRFICRIQSDISRAPGIAFAGSIILIDVFGTRYLLSLDICKNWEDVHDFLLDQYEGKSAVEFIRSHAYRITDTNQDGSFVRRQDWAFVREGTTLELSFAVRQASLMCPWCMVQAVFSDSGRIQCHACERRFWASKDSVGSIREPARDVEHARVPEPDISRSARSDHTAEPTGSSQIGLQPYRRLVVVCSDSIDSQHRTTSRGPRHIDLDRLMHVPPHTEYVSSATPSHPRGEHIPQDFTGDRAVHDSAGQGYINVLDDMETAISATRVDALIRDISDHDQGHLFQLMESQPLDIIMIGHYFELTMDVDIQQSDDTSVTSQRLNILAHSLVDRYVGLGLPLPTSDTFQFLKERFTGTFEADIFGINITLIRALHFLSTAWSFSGIESFDSFIYLALSQPTPESESGQLIYQTFHHFDDGSFRLKLGANYSPQPFISIWIGLPKSPYPGEFIENPWTDDHQFLPLISWVSRLGTVVRALQIELDFDRSIPIGIPIGNIPIAPWGNLMDTQSWLLPSSLKLLVRFDGYQNQTYEIQLHTSSAASRVSASRLAEEVSKRVCNYLSNIQPSRYESRSRGSGGRKIGIEPGAIFISNIGLVGVRFLSPDTVEPILQIYTIPHPGSEATMPAINPLGAHISHKRRRGQDDVHMFWGNTGWDFSGTGRFTAPASSPEVNADMHEDETVYEAGEGSAIDDYEGSPRARKRARWGYV